MYEGRNWDSAAVRGGTLRPGRDAPHFKRIAVEEAFVTRPILESWQADLDVGSVDRAFQSLYAGLLRGSAGAPLVSALLNVGEARIAAMDAAGVDLQVLSLTAPGVQLYDASKASAAARNANDLLARVVADHPKRFAGLATVAPQDPVAAAGELTRAIEQLELSGVLINSHTQGEYLDSPEYKVFFEVAQELRVPVYLHPNTPSPQMTAPYLSYGLEGPVWGFAAETSLHALRLIFSGLFDEFPRLQIVLGHLGEGLPFWLPRIDSRAQMMSRFAGSAAGKLRRQPSEYFKDNFLVTTSGMNWPAGVEFAVAALGAERVLFAADYPYESMHEAVTLMDGARLSPVQFAQIYQHNAERIFKLAHFRNTAGVLEPRNEQT